MRGRDLIDERSVGFAAGPDGPLCSPAMRFQAGSISKLVLATAVLALVEHQQLRLQEPIVRWLGEMPSPWRSITLHQLLSHTSGLGHWGDIPGLPSLLATPPPRDHLVALITDAPLVDEPGTIWRYSGPGFVIAALVVEAATGTAYGNMVTDLVLRPAGLRETTSGEFPLGQPNVAIGHDRGRPVRVDPGFADVPGTGDLWSTTEDLIQLAQALRAGRVIEPAAAAQLWTSQARLGDSSDAASPVRVAAYGYGTFLGRIHDQAARINPGDNPGYQSLLAYLPDLNLDLAVLCNEEAPSVNAALGELRYPLNP